MKKYLIISILILLNSCKPSPTYNVFDEKFDISIREVINDRCDTISAGCGYFNLQQKNGRLRTYYQIYDSDIVAKGFVYFLDTLKTNGETNFNKFHFVKIKEKDIIELNFELEKYGYQFLSQGKGTYGSYFVRIINLELKDTVCFPISLDYNSNKDSLIYRKLTYLRSPKTPLIK